MTSPLATYGLVVPPGGREVGTSIGLPATIHLTMAAIDPTESNVKDSSKPGGSSRVTLLLIRENLFEDSDFEDAESGSDLDSDSDSDSMPNNENMSKLKKRLDSSGGSSDVDYPFSSNGISKKSKSSAKNGKSQASKKNDPNGMDLDSPHEKKKNSKLDDSFASDNGTEKFVVCTLDANKIYQQPIDISITSHEKVSFLVNGNLSVHLTGNIVRTSADYDDSESDEDLDEDEYDDLDMLDDESIDDELDDLRTPRISEVNSDDEEAPKLTSSDRSMPAINGKPSENKAKKNQHLANLTANKSPNKRPAPNSENSSHDGTPGTASEGADGAKLSKRQKKKLKNNAVNEMPASAESNGTPKLESSLRTQNDLAKDSPANSKSDKKVQFAKSLEQGPTPKTTKAPSAPDTQKSTASGIKFVQGVKLDDRKVGDGPTAKKGDRVSVRYIGKLEKNGEVFDANKKGKPFSFKLGAGEVIKGWDLGVSGMAPGGERRISVPAHLGYGSKSMGRIPPNSNLIFDVKLLEIN